MEFIVAAETDIGLRNTTNQDSLLIRKAFHPGIGTFIFAVICDGMGGLEKGELASSAVINDLRNWFDKSLSERISKYGSIEYEWLKTDLNDLIQTENIKIRRYGAERGIQLGTTVTIFLIIENNYYILHVGDCRVYELSTEIHQLTRDQTVEEWAIQKGLVKRGRSGRNYGNNILLQCVGASEIVEPQFYRGSVNGKTGYMLCSDGFRHMVTMSEIKGYLMNCEKLSQKALKQQLRNLIVLNKQRLEQDNITAAVIAITSVLPETLGNGQIHTADRVTIVEEIILTTANAIWGEMA